MGPFQVMLAGQPVQGFAYDKVRALLAYLAVEYQSPHRRETLGALFWPEANATTARTNLRKALSTLRKALGNSDDSPFLTIRQDHVQLNLDNNCWLDVDQLKSRLDAVPNHAHWQAELEEAVSLYRGSFLQGLTVNSLEFEEWMLAIRESLHVRILTALHELTQYYLRQGEFGLAQKHALRQVELEPYREEAHCALMESLASSGQRSAALGQYERCRRILAEELGIEPSQKTQKLYQRIRSAGEARPHNLPVQSQPLVGRQVECYEIGRLLASPDCRLLTLMGLGGIGKTSLALQAACLHLENFWHGVFWVPLAALRRADQMLAAIFDALPISMSGEPERQLIDYLREKSILLVLDNFEHLVSPDCEAEGGALRLVNTILKDTRHVKLLVTSRERLCLRSEWVYPVEGLPYPEDFPIEDIDTLRQYAAIQLFVRRARQLDPGFPAQDEVYLHIARICELVNGIPLGIELASGWVNQLDCQTIADEIEGNLDFLVTSLRDLPGRHQSLRAVFEHSWKLLPAEEKAVLRKLSVMQTVFSRVAASEIAQAQPHQLTALVNKSLLQVDVAGQYNLHPLLKGFLAQELAADHLEEHNSHRMHAVYFARFLKEREHVLTVQYQAAGLEDVGNRIEDVLAAWDWAVIHRDVTILSGALEGVFIYYWARNQFHQGRAILDVALQALNNLDESPSKQLMVARLQTRIADFVYWLGDLEAAEQLLRESIPIFEILADAQELAGALELSGRISYWQGDYQKSQAAATAAVELARRSGPPQTLAQALSSLANTLCESCSDYETADMLYAESLVIYRQLENRFGIAKVLINQGAVNYERGDFARAQQRYQESLSLYRELNYTYGISACLNNLALLTRKLGDTQRARVLIEESLVLKRETGNRVAILHALLEIGALDTAMGNYAQAREHYCEAVQMAQETQASGLMFSILLGFAELFEQTGDFHQSAQLTAWVLAQEDTSQEVCSQAGALKCKLEEKMDPAELAQYQQPSKQQTVDHLISGLMGE